MLRNPQSTSEHRQDEHKNKLLNSFNVYLWRQSADKCNHIYIYILHFFLPTHFEKSIVFLSLSPAPRYMCHK